LLLPDLAISCNGEVRSVMLFSTRPAEELGGAQVLVSRSSMTSVALLDLLFEHVWKVKPVFVPGDAEADDLRRDATPVEARLVIGDAALMLRHQTHPVATAHGRSYPYTYDLGLEWKRWTGLPFVFAVWVARREVSARAALQVHGALMESRDWGLTHLPQISADASGSCQLPAPVIHEYLAGLDYGLGLEYLEGLSEFSAAWNWRARCRRGSWSSSRPREPRLTAPLSLFLTMSEFSELLDLYQRAPLLELGALADARRRELHPEQVVTYIVDRNINYTNVCVADCGFCAFYRRPKHGEGYTLSYEQIGEKIEETKALGGVQILIQGGHNPYIPFEWYLELIKYIKRNHPIHVHGFSPSEVDFWAQLYRMDAREVVRQLIAAGLDSIPGGGGEILVQRVRDIVAPKKAGADRWLEIMEIAHEEGLKTSCTMMYGIGETLEERMEHLLRLRDVQSRTGGFTAFITWPLQPENTPKLSAQPKTDAVEYLRTVAFARLVLDNIPNLQASWVTMGLKIGQIALSYGCNDFGSLMIEENVVSAANTTFHTTTDEIERLIADAGFTPRRRRQDYQLIAASAAA
ncbi:MAG: dehypoxanthine futalosine cyclase, partial [Gemmatimonadaceae bacterium]|nr:dehypoxanthine futalosine cyclase [Gemmatimonadaceae bacterium]